MESEKAKGMALLEKFKEGMEGLALIYQNAIQDGDFTPFDLEEDVRLWRLWREFRRSIEDRNETRTVVALHEMLEYIMESFSPTEHPQPQKG